MIVDSHKFSSLCHKRSTNRGPPITCFNGNYKRDTFFLQAITALVQNFPKPMVSSMQQILPIVWNTLTESAALYPFFWEPLYTINIYVTEWVALFGGGPQIPSIDWIGPLSKNSLVYFKATFPSESHVKRWFQPFAQNVSHSLQRDGWFRMSASSQSYCRVAS